MAGTIRAQYPPSIRPIRLICSARVSLDHIIRSFSKGADGVIVVGCHVGECDYDTGNEYAANLVSYAQEVLESIGLERERLKMEYCSAAEGARFQKFVTQFDQKIHDLGPNPMQFIDPRNKGKK